MTISKKHFEALAEAIKETKSDRQSHHPANWIAEWAIDRLALRLAKAFAEFNPNFDKDRFIKAADVQEWVIDRAKVAEAKERQKKMRSLSPLAIWIAEADRSRSRR